MTPANRIGYSVDMTHLLDELRRDGRRKRDAARPDPDPTEEQGRADRDELRWQAATDRERS